MVVGRPVVASRPGELRWRRGAGLAGVDGDSAGRGQRVVGGPHQPCGRRARPTMTRLLKASTTALSPARRGRRGHGARAVTLAAVGGRERRQRVAGVGVDVGGRRCQGDRHPRRGHHADTGGAPAGVDEAGDQGRWPASGPAQWIQAGRRRGPRRSARSPGAPSSESIWITALLGDDPGAQRGLQLVRARRHPARQRPDLRCAEPHPRRALGLLHPPRGPVRGRRRDRPRRRLRAPSSG